MMEAPMLTTHALVMHVTYHMPDILQALKYGSREDYKNYVRDTPMLIPFTAGDDLEEILKTAKVQAC